MDCVAFGATHIPIRFRLPMVLLSAFSTSSSSSSLRFLSCLTYHLEYLMDLLFVIPCRTVALKILNSLDDSMQQVGSVLHFEMSAFDATF